MSEGLYRKEGSSRALTRIGDRLGVTAAREAGVAGIRAGRFFSASADPAGSGPADDGALAAMDAAIRAALPPGIAIVRAHILAAETNHAVDEEGGRNVAWAERHARCRIELVALRSGTTVTLVRGGEVLTAIDPAEFGRIGTLLDRCEADANPLPDVVLAPAVTAALTHALAARADALPRDVPLVQAGHDAWPRDGAGFAVQRFAAAGRERRDWPNVYRPSYRSPAVPAILHAELELPPGPRPGKVPSAIAIVGGVALDDEGLEAALLVEAGARAVLSRLRLSLASIARLRRIGEARSWFPYGAGCWGSEVFVSPAAPFTTG